MSLEKVVDSNRVIYLDCHSTTPTDPIVLEAMWPCFSEVFGNPGSPTHAYGVRARELVDAARATFARVLAVESDEIVFTSGATESNNLAIFGAAKRWQGKRKHLVTIGIEHPSVLEPIRQLEREGWRVSVVPVGQQQATGTLTREGSMSVPVGDLEWPGVVDLEALWSVLSEDTALVSISIANHEIGVIQPIRQIADLAHSVGALLHTDATQAVGWLPLDLDKWQADIVSFSGHKFYGPKGVGALYVRRRETYPGARPVRLFPRILGGGQEFGFRSGTLNTPGIVGIATALRLAHERQTGAAKAVGELRQRLWNQLTEWVPDIQLNGPNWQAGGPRLPNNLNFAVPFVEGQTIMLRATGVAVSSGSACSSSTPGVSMVLRAIGLSEDAARSSLRIGLGRFHTRDDIDLAAERLSQGILLSRG
ncbi:MAG: cysteine desulfurase family protein [Pirellulaceae bacterium]|nr:cysteine desulfurase family protein [Pirellulaceae bacterium]